MYIFLVCTKMIEISPETESHVNSVTVNKRDGNKVVWIKWWIYKTNQAKAIQDKICKTKAIKGKYGNKNLTK